MSDISPGAAHMLQGLFGRRLDAASRESGVLMLRFVADAPPAGLPADTPLDAPLDAPPLVLQVACAWRLADADHVLVASGDLFAPADPDADLETFDWETPGATWWDVALARALAGRATPPRVERVEPDVLGGLRLELDAGLVFEAFANSTSAPHVETEFWRLGQEGDGAQLVVGTNGATLEE
jgi:hypothetical protein